MTETFSGYTAPWVVIVCSARRASKTPRSTPSTWSRSRRRSAARYARTMDRSEAPYTHAEATKTTSLSTPTSTGIAALGSVRPRAGRSGRRTPDARCRPGRAPREHLHGHRAPGRVVRPVRRPERTRAVRLEDAVATDHPVTRGVGSGWARERLDGGDACLRERRTTPQAAAHRRRHAALALGASHRFERPERYHVRPGSRLTSRAGPCDPESHRCEPPLHACSRCSSPGSSARSPRAPSRSRSPPSTRGRRPRRSPGARRWWPASATRPSRSASSRTCSTRPPGPVRQRYLAPAERRAYLEHLVTPTCSPPRRAGRGSTATPRCPPRCAASCRSASSSARCSRP